MTEAVRIFFKEMGLARSAGQKGGLLYFSANPLSRDEIVAARAAHHGLSWDTSQAQLMAFSRRS